MDSVLRDSLHLMVAAAPAHERVQEWPLVSWQSAVGVVLLYLGGVWLGQQVMAARKPFKGLGFRAFIMAHNLSMTVLSLYMVVQMLTQAYMAYGWSCKLQVLGNMAEPGPTFSPASARLASVLWLHYLSKHASTFLGWWAVINFAPGGDAYFVGAVNSAVHVVMYSYYFVISTGVVKVPQAIKQGITLLQLLQFTAFGLGANSFGVSMSSMVEASERLWAHTVDFLIAPVYFDERTQDWPLASWKSATSIVLLYVVAVPAAKIFMRDRKSVNVRPFAMAHNLFMAALSLYMVIETLSQQYYCEGWDRKGFQPWGSLAEPGTSFSPHCYRLARIMWIHYLSKVYEFTDTFIMIAKKNFHQVSFLHMYHHATTMLCWWTVVNFAPGGDTYFTCLVNSWVHVVMYSYYFVASTGLVKVPSIFKQGITIMQMIQFSAFFSQAAFGVFIATYYRPRIVVVLALWQAVVFTCLFGNFFWQTYIKKKRTDGKPEATRTKTPSPGVQADIQVKNGKRQGQSSPIENGKLLNGKLLNGKVPYVKAHEGGEVGNLQEPLLK